MLNPSHARNVMATLLAIAGMTLGCGDTTVGPDQISPGLGVNYISPNNGSPGGNTLLTINGGGFQPGATVTLDGTPATDTVVNSLGVIVARTPAHAAGVVDLVVTNPDGKSATLSRGYTYNGASGAPPSVTAISPNVGSTDGGGFLSISGTGFRGGRLGVIVTLGGTTLKVSFASDTAILVDEYPGPCRGTGGPRRDQPGWAAREAGWRV